MTGLALLTAAKLIALVAFILWFFQTAVGRKIGRFLPTPFWVYFLSIVAGAVHLLPRESAAYGWLGLHALPMSLVLLLIGAPVMVLAKLGPRAVAAMLIGTASMFIGTVASFLVLGSFLPEEGWKMAGAMLGTWTGGSANMLAVKELLDLSDAGMGPLIITDTFLSYGWLAFLMTGVAIQKWFDRGTTAHLDARLKDPSNPKSRPKFARTLWQTGFVLFAGAVIAEATVLGGEWLAPRYDFLTVKGWAILLSTTVAVILALTPFNRLEEWGASRMGTFILYVVLASIGAGTHLTRAVEESFFVVIFGLSVLLIHGFILFFAGRALRIPLFLLATASQANVGGPVSAPIVASVYRPGAAQMGVLMAILGAILGSYVGWLGALVCRALP